MLQHIYISTARSPMSDSDIQSILDVSRRRNAVAELTGLLVAGRNRFLQVLEGREEAVTAALARIAVDTRHRAIVTLSNRAIAKREFGCWAMGFRHSSAFSLGNDLHSIVEQLLDGVEDKNLRAQFAGFAQIHSRAA